MTLASEENRQLASIATTHTPARKKHTIFCIRHGQAVHNVMYERLGRGAYFGRLPWQIDTELTDVGHAQARALSAPPALHEDSCETTTTAVPAVEDAFPERADLRLVFVSPLTRTLQTLSNIFQAEIESTGRFKVDSAFRPTGRWTEAELRTVVDVSGFDRPVRERELMNSDCTELSQASSNRTQRERSIGVERQERRDEGGSQPEPPAHQQAAQHRSELPIRFVATEHAREYAMGMPPNMRKSRSWLERAFPWVDFSLLESEDDEASWAHLGGRSGEVDDADVERVEDAGGLRVESMAFFERRVAGLRKFLEERLAEEMGPGGALWEEVDEVGDPGGGEEAERIRVAVVGHSGSLGMMMNGVLGDEKNALKHCFPYRFQL